MMDCLRLVVVWIFVLVVDDLMKLIVWMFGCDISCELKVFLLGRMLISLLGRLVLVRYFIVFSIVSEVWIGGLMMRVFLVVSLGVVNFVNISSGKFYGVMMVQVLMVCCQVCICLSGLEDGSVLLYSWRVFLVCRWNNCVVLLILVCDLVRGLFCFRVCSSVSFLMCVEIVLLMWWQICVCFYMFIWCYLCCVWLVVVIVWLRFVLVVMGRVVICLFVVGLIILNWLFFVLLVQVLLMKS